MSFKISTLMNPGLQDWGQPGQHSEAYLKNKKAPNTSHHQKTSSENNVSDSKLYVL